MADQRLDALTEITAPVGTDLVYVEHDPAGTPVDRKAKLANLLTAIGATPTGTSIATTGGAKEGFVAGGNSGASKTIDLSTGNLVELTLTANCTLTFPTVANDGEYTFGLDLVQDVIGGRTVTWPASVQWAGDIAPTLSTVNGKRDTFTFRTKDGGTTWLGFVAGLGFGFAPTDIAGLRLWLRADALALNDGDPVGTWTDSSGLAHNATQATGGNKPLFKTAQAGTKPVIRFDGVDDYLQIANHVDLQPLLGSWTVIVVLKRLGAGGGDVPQIIGSRPWASNVDKGWAVVYGGSAGAGKMASHFADGAAGHDSAASGGYPGNAVANTLISTSLFEIWEVHEDRVRTGFYTNGVLTTDGVTDVPTAAINQTNTVYIGRDIDGGNSRKANIDLAEVIIYAADLTAAQRAKLTTYLKAKYTIA